MKFLQRRSAFTLIELLVADVRDGTSSTIMVGEANYSTQPTRGTFWAYSYGGYNSSAGFPSLWMLSGD